MPNIFSKINIGDNKITSSKSTMGIMSLFYENATKENIAYYDSAIEFLRSVYTGNKDSIVSIIREAFFDFSFNLKNTFFNSMNSIIDSNNKRMIEKCRSIISKYKINNVKDVEFKEFTVKGYNYTIDNIIEVDYGIIDDIITKSDTYIDDIINDKKVPTVAVNLAYSDINSHDAYNQYRGAILGLDSVEVQDYRRILRASFRGNQENKIEILVNRNTLREYTKKIIQLENLLPKLDYEKRNIDTMKRKINEYSANSSMLFKEENSTTNIRGVDIYDKNKVCAVAAIYSQTTTALRTVYNMYLEYHVEKLNAINEALSFYDGILSRVGSY